ncbi:MAG: response regulator transcription factor [Clostridiales bacterium]|nr:response regulator transcription factor [Clostridiales bacterium]MBO4579381.1 response regulator transcription factor [Clostridiales bacterium]
MTKILIIDDDNQIVTGTSEILDSAGYEVLSATSAKGGYEIAVSQSPDIILLDWMMPEMSGMQFLEKYREEGFQTPVIMLTGKGDEATYESIALDGGADVYIAKPYNASALLSQIKALKRRLEYNDKRGKESANRRVYCDGELIIDNDAMQAFKYEESCDLTNREFQLLQYLEENAGRVCSRGELLKQVWKYDFLGDERTVDVTIKRTRQKIEPDQKYFKYILTRRGFGYFFPNDLK